MTTPAPRQYHLTLAAGPTGPRARITRTGPGNVLDLAVGRTLAEGITLAGLLFPICPRAHQAAALAAAEHAMGLELEPGQGAARDALVLAEAVAGCVWRSGMGWTRLLDEAPMAGPVKRAREASAGLQSALFAGRWAEPGGGELRIDPAGIRQALWALTHSVHAVARLENRLLDRVSDALGPGRLASFTTLGDRLDETTHCPSSRQGEETPRSLCDPGAATVSPPDWYAAQLDHAYALVALLRDALSALSETPASRADTDATGTGLGLSMTARGRLRHVISLRGGRIEAWKAAAPTDWNFAPGGPLEHYVSALDSENPAEAARWILGALDPCAPCQVAHESEAAHA